MMGDRPTAQAPAASPSNPVLYNQQQFSRSDNLIVVPLNKTIPIVVQGRPTLSIERRPLERGTQLAGGEPVQFRTARSDVACGQQSYLKSPPSRAARKASSLPIRRRFAAIARITETGRAPSCWSANPGRRRWFDFE